MKAIRAIIILLVIFWIGLVAYTAVEFGDKPTIYMAIGLTAIISFITTQYVIKPHNNE